MPEPMEAATALELFEAAPCGYLFTDPDGMITKVNQTFLRWTGFSSAALVRQKHLQDLLTVPAQIFYETHFAPLLRMQGYVKEITVDFVCANGSSLPALVNSTIEADAAGNPLFVRTTVFDIRERRRYERELLLERRKAERLASVVENANDAIITVSDQLKVESWNRGAESLFGYSATEAIGRDFRDLIVPAESLDELNKQLIAVRNGVPTQYETVRLNKEGNRIAVAATITPHINPPDEFSGLSAILRDITPRKKKEAERHAQDHLELANHLAHEINNPLQSLLNCLAILSLEGDSEYVKLAEEQLDRVAQVVLDLLNLTRPAKTTKASEPSLTSD
jgi:PAS domain S-box-containing protein